MSSIRCDIALIPSDDLAEKGITMSAQLQTHGAAYQLNEAGPFPHASLYFVQLKVADLDQVKELLASIAASTPQLNLTATCYDQAHGYIDAEYARTETLDNLQMAAVEAINPLRDGLHKNDQARLPEATGKLRENLEKYGYRGVGELFRPHLTFTRFTNDQPIDTSTFPSPDHFSGTFTKLGLFELGSHGTCIRKIAEFNLERGSND